LTIPYGAVKITLRWLNTPNVKAEIAQLVEHATENRGVPSSILGLGTSRPGGQAGCAGVVQLVERLLAKEKVVGSSPIARSGVEIEEFGLLIGIFNQQS
jgi:hypothetical protein